MSIYASTWGTDADDHADNCRRWNRGRRKGKARGPTRAHFADGATAWLDNSRPCTCHAGPVRYDGSHILPDEASPRAGSVDLAEIPGWITRADRPPLDPDETGERVWPWLRLWVTADGPKDLPPGNAVVVLDRDQVADMHDYLGRWLERSEPAKGADDATP